MQKEKEKAFRVVTLGCRTNQYESQGFRDQLKKLGFREVNEKEDTDLFIVNTCTVTASADSASRHEIHKIHKAHPDASIVVTGCSAERSPESYKNMQGVTHVIANQDKENLLPLVLDIDEMPEFSITRFDAHTRAFVKIQDGCNSFCTYCIIPYVRGRSRSRSIPDIIKEIEVLIANGYKEIVLTGINIGDFDGAPKEGEKKRTLAELIKEVDQIPGIERIRVSSIDPDEVDDELKEAILYGKHTSQSMHLVLQSGSNVILKRMNRKYTRQIFLDSVEKLRKENPDFTFTTDVIVGFPGETDLDFSETLDVLKEVCFSKVHMFPYSDRPRTRAFLWKDKVESSVIRKRKREILETSEKISFRLREKFVGRTMTILTEKREKDSSLIFGHTDNFLGVWIDDETIGSNELVGVDLVENQPEGLIGKIAKQEVTKAC